MTWIRRLVVLALACSGSPKPAPPVAKPPVVESSVIEHDGDDSDPVAVKVLEGDRHQVSCTFETVFPDKPFHGVTPWSTTPNPFHHASCCVLPSTSILCLLTEDAWIYARTENDNTTSFHYAVEHARLFDARGRTPWRDAIVSVFFSGPMNNPMGRAEVLASARLEIDDKSFRVIPTLDTACTHDELACDDGFGEPAACAAYRRTVGPFVRRFCDGRGDFTWRGARLVNRTN